MTPLRGSVGNHLLDHGEEQIVLALKVAVERLQ
jgi:hypothetical protein